MKKNIFLAGLICLIAASCNTQSAVQNYDTTSAINSSTTPAAIQPSDNSIQNIQPQILSATKNKVKPVHHNKPSSDSNPIQNSNTTPEQNQQLLTPANVPPPLLQLPNIQTPAQPTPAPQNDFQTQENLRKIRIDQQYQEKIIALKNSKDSAAAPLEQQLNDLQIQVNNLDTQYINSSCDQFPTGAAANNCFNIQQKKMTIQYQELSLTQQLNYLNQNILTNLNALETSYLYCHNSPGCQSLN